MAWHDYVYVGFVLAMCVLPWCILRRHDGAQEHLAHKRRTPEE